VPKLPKGTKKEMNPLQWALYNKAETREQGCDLLTLIGAGKPFVNELGDKEFANSAKIRRDIRVLLQHRVLILK